MDKILMYFLKFDFDGKVIFCSNNHHKFTFLSYHNSKER